MGNKEFVRIWKQVVICSGIVMEFFWMDRTKTGKFRRIIGVSAEIRTEYKSDALPLDPT
jgi:hypothetical protein